MSSTTFEQFKTPINADWLNDVNRKTYGPPSQDDSSLVGYLPAGTGAVATTVQTKLRESVSVKDFGAVGDGVTDDTTRIQSAITATASGGVLFFPPGTYKVSVLTVTGKAITLFGYGATLNCTGATGAIQKTDHGNKLIVKGLSFTGSGAGINHTATPSTTVYDELSIEDCSFDMNSGVYGVISSGSREAVFQKCTFNNTSSGNGIYFSQSVSPFVNLCLFRGTSGNGTAVNYPSTGTGYDAGLVLRDTEIMGWANGVVCVGLDWLCIQGCTIDYNTQSIKIAAQDGANISNNYIGSVGTNAAMWITYDATAAAPKYSDKIIIENNTFTGHYTGGNTYDCILIDGTVSPDNIQIKNNNIHFYTRYGINVTMTNTRINISGNNFGQRSGFGVAPIYNTLGASDSGFVIKDNYFSNATTVAAMNISAACTMLASNLGCSTETKGQVTIGVGAFTTTFSHGLAYTPNNYDVQVIPLNTPAATAVPYVSTITSTQITINTNAVVATSTAGIGYTVRRSL